MSTSYAFSTLADDDDSSLSKPMITLMGTFPRLAITIHIEMMMTYLGREWPINEETLKG